jgi:hypothetical protein
MGSEVPPRTVGGVLGERWLTPLLTHIEAGFTSTPRPRLVQFRVKEVSVMRLFAAVALLLAVLSLLPASRVVAGPPPAVSSQLVLEPVTEKLIRLRLESDPKRKLALVKQLGPIRDARVTVALMELVLNAQREDAVLLHATFLLCKYHIPDKDVVPPKYWTLCRLWWENNEADVRRRAKQLP